jgi:hypothetical protein
MIMKYSRYLTLFIALLLALPMPAFAQANVRGVHADGQTWLVWEETSPKPFTYDVYVSTAPIESLETAELTGRIFPEDWRAERLTLAQSNATWTIPDGAGGAYSIESGEALFVYTPHTASAEYFAVVKNGESEISTGNSIGPIAQSLDPVQCHAQLSGVSELGQDYTIYAHWIDGRENFDDGRSDYPVMGNHHANGTGHVFAVFEPEDGRKAGPMPAVVALHGGGLSNYFRFGKGSAPLIGIKTTFEDGFIVSIDDCLFVNKTTALGSGVWPEPTRWFGYWPEYNRFELPGELPPDDAIIVDYTQRRVDFILDWLLTHEQIDPDRLSIFGLSGGGSGVLFSVKRNPNRFAAATSFVMPFEGTTFTLALFMQGGIDQNLKTNLPGGIGLRDWYWPLTLLYEQEEMPFMRLIVGKQDFFMDWELQVEAFRLMENQKWGAHIFWDQRDHIWNWEGTHWFGSPRLGPKDMSRFRRNQSFPAFSNDDQNPISDGRQPDIGNEGRESGDPWGTWGGYYNWEPETISDTADEWAATIYLLGESEFASDVPEFDESTADVTIRRAQHFKPAPDELCTWSLMRISDNQITQEGNLSVAENGLVTVSALVITKDASRLRIALDNADDDTDDDGNDDSDNDADDDDANDDDAIDDDNEGDAGGDDDGGSCGC